MTSPFTNPQVQPRTVAALMLKHILDPSELGLEEIQTQWKAARTVEEADAVLDEHWQQIAAAFGLDIV